MLVAIGLIWFLQGLGVLMWPAGSVMLARREWAAYGAITTMIGLVLIWMGGRAARR